MTTIQLQIKDCSQCPFFKQEKVYTADSFENVNDWICGYKGRTKIAQIETFDRNPKVPIWCPLKVKE